MIHTLICHTEGCINENISIDFYRPAELIVCGPCNKRITDIDPPIPAGGYEPEEEE